MNATSQLESAEHLRQQYVDFRIELRQMLCDRGVASNPCWGNHDIVNALRVQLKGSALTAQEQFSHGVCASWNDEYSQLRQGVVDSFAFSQTSKASPAQDSPLVLLRSLRELLSLDAGFSLLRGINLPYSDRQNVA